MLIVKVEEPELETEVELKLPDAPEGNPLKARLTLPVKPLIAETDTVSEALFPAVTLSELEESLSEKLGGALTVREMVAVLVRLPLVTFTVSL